MKEKLITFKTAQLAKEKGFKNYYGHTSYRADGTIGSWEGKYDHNGKPETLGFFKNDISAPTQHQLQKWLREKHNIDIVIKPMTGDIKGQKNYVADVMIFGTTYYQKLARADSYEDALESGLYEALSYLTV